MAMSGLVADADARARALDATRSFLCRAPAGSGKTELLTQRFLTLLARAGQPEEIIAITFTRKAAAEMRDRILGAIKWAAKQPRPDTAHERLTWDLARQVLTVNNARQWALLDNPNRLQLKTFDSLCAYLANSLPAHSSFASPPLITETPMDLYTEAARALLQSMEADRPWSASIGVILQLMDNNTQKLERLLAAMLAHREAWLPIIGGGGHDRVAITRRLQKNLQQVCAETIAKLIAAIPADYQTTLIDLAKLAASHLAQEKTQKEKEKASAIVNCLAIDETLGLPTADTEGLQQWLGLVELLLNKTNQWRKVLDRRTGFPSGDTPAEKKWLQQQKQQCLQLIEDLSRLPGLLDLLTDVRHLPNASYDDNQAMLLHALIEILPVLSGYLQLCFQEANSIDFAEVSLKARSALDAMGSPTELALALDYKIQHLLVDEFQDVSPAQFELLKLLTRGWQVDDGRSVFFVGDPMQSIYSFRSANVGLFLQCSENGIGEIPLETLNLTTNFRSQAGIVAWVNKLFARSFPSQHDIVTGAVSYSHSEPMRAKLPLGGVWVHGFDEGTDERDEARMLMDIVSQSRRDNPQGVIAILVRNRRHALHITPLLASAQLKYRAVDLDSLADNIVIQDLVSLTHALLFPADRIAWLSLLRAPWCGLSLVDLTIVANFGGGAKSPLTLLQQLLKLLEKPADMLATDAIIAEDNSSTRLLTDDGRARLARIVPILEVCIAQVQRKSLRQWVEGAWIVLGGPACVKEAHDLKNAERYFQLLESLDWDTVIKKRDTLSKAVNALYSAPDPDSDDKLQIMTIHKAKGLEFDTVIVPALARGARGAEPELLRWHEHLSADGEPLLLMSPITSSGQEKDPIGDYLVRQAKRRRLNENKRLLYVACTRARDNLHLLAQVQSDQRNADKLRCPAQTSLLYALWPAVQSTIIRYKNSDSADTTTDTPAQPAAEPAQLQRLNRRWQLPTLTHSNLLADCIPYYAYDNPPLQGESWQDPTSRYIGIIVHRMLQRLTLDELQATNWRRYRPQWRMQLKTLGVARSLMTQAVDKVATSIDRIAADTSIHWLFDDRYPRRETEYAVTLARSNNVKQYVIDLLLADGKDTWIVDYKTSQPESHQEKKSIHHATISALLSYYATL
jgi:ATP-dependent helicase/nuclease subunit A